MRSSHMLAVLALARLALDAGAERDTVLMLTAEVTDESVALIINVLGASASTEPNKSEPVVHAWGSNGYTKCGVQANDLQRYETVTNESVAILGQEFMINCPECVSRNKTSLVWLKRRAGEPGDNEPVHFMQPPSGLTLCGIEKVHPSFIVDASTVADNRIEHVCGACVGRYVQKGMAPRD